MIITMKFYRAYGVVSKVFRAWWQVVDVVYVDEVDFNLHLTLQFGRVLMRTKMPTNLSNSRAQNFIFGGCY